MKFRDAGCQCLAEQKYRPTQGVGGASWGTGSPLILWPRAARTLFQREASQAERERLKRFLNSYPSEPAEKWAAVARVMFASNEFLFVE